MSIPSTRPQHAIASRSSLALCMLAFALPVAATQAASAAATSAPLKVAVFPFELKDSSPAGGVLAPDAIDAENLKASTDLVREMLAANGGFSVVDTSDVADDVATAGGALACNGCDASIAKELGADQSLVGFVTRVSRAEYTVQIVVRDAETGEVFSNNFSGLRMGANYSWPRGVRSLMNRMLPKPAP